MILTQNVRGFSRGNGAARFTSREPIAVDRLRELAPSIFAEQKHDSRSERYTYIPTGQIVEHLDKNGYGVHEVIQAGTRQDDRVGFTKHLIRFRPAGALAPMKVGDTLPEIVLVNSHDGSSAYHLIAGLFRLVCSNGLITSESTIESVKVHHKGRILEDVADGVERIRVQLPAVLETVSEWKALPLSRPEQLALAESALTVKYGHDDDGRPAAPISPEQALSLHRNDDRANDLYTTMNVLQENLIRGGTPYIHTSETTRRRSRRRTSPVNSVEGTTNINRALWQLAERMKTLKS